MPGIQSRVIGHPVLFWVFATPCTPPGSSVHGILRARTLEWVAISSSRGSSWPRDWTRISCLQVDSLPLRHLWSPLGYKRGLGKAVMEEQRKSINEERNRDGKRKTHLWWPLKNSRYGLRSSRKKCPYPENTCFACPDSKISYLGDLFLGVKILSPLVSFPRIMCSIIISQAP